ncbi:hypothetical protein ACLI4Q_14055 [Natrialbaceae archaeon A-CW1-1]
MVLHRLLRLAIHFVGVVTVYGDYLDPTTVVGLEATFIPNMNICENRMTSNYFRENIIFLSSLGRYNTERRPIVRQYFDWLLRSGELNQEEIRIEDVRNFGSQKRPILEEGNPEFDEIFQEILLTLPEDINPQDFQGYLLFRYTHLEDPLEEVGQFTLHDLLSLEALLRDTILEDTSEMLSDQHRFESTEEYAEFSSVYEPSDQFRQEWNERITLDVRDVLKEFVEGTLPDDPTFDPNLHEERINTGQEILEFLSYSGDRGARMDFLSNPLFQLDGNRSEIVVPFPEVLLTTSQYRIEEYISHFKDVQNVENHRKGDIVEELAQGLLRQIPSRNFVKNFQYVHDPHPGEADSILFFDSSYWTVEVKSHPIFRKIPRQIELVKDRYTDKVVQAIDQTRRANDYLDSIDNKFGLIYNLTGHKDPGSLISGGIIILDGFIPTLFSGNERADREMGMEQIHQYLTEDDRVVVITLYDLYQLIQEEGIEDFDEFLLWRTGYNGNIPVWGYSEREYWAFYFDNYRGNKEFQEGVETAAEKDIITVYISARFNDKSHLQNLVD